MNGTGALTTAGRDALFALGVRASIADRMWFGASVRLAVAVLLIVGAATCKKLPPTPSDPCLAIMGGRCAWADRCFHTRTGLVADMFGRDLADCERKAASFCDGAYVCENDDAGRPTTATPAQLSTCLQSYEGATCDVALKTSCPSVCKKTRPASSAP